MQGERAKSDLVLYQGDERGDDDGDAGSHDGRQLIAQALAAARGHEHEAVSLAEHCVDGLLLVLPEFAVAEVLRVLGPKVLWTGRDNPSSTPAE